MRNIRSSIQERRGRNVSVRLVSMSPAMAAAVREENEREVLEYRKRFDNNRKDRSG